MRSNRVATTLGVLFISVSLGACGASSHSSPTLSITQSRVTSNAAELGLRIDNPGSLDLELTEIDYTLVYGPLPVADGRWSGSQAIAPESSVTMTLPIRFDRPPMDPGAEDIQFSGEMRFNDKSNRGKMKFQTATFNVEARKSSQ